MKKDSGQALIALLLGTAIIMFWAIESATLNISQVNLSSSSTEGRSLLIKAEGYLEDSIITYLRYPDYNGRTYPAGDITCTVQISGVGYNKNINSICEKGEKSRSVEVNTFLNEGVFTFSKITEK